MDLQIQVDTNVILIAEIEYTISCTAGTAQCLAAIIRVAKQPEECFPTGECVATSVSYWTHV